MAINTGAMHAVSRVLPRVIRLKNHLSILIYHRVMAEPDFMLPGEPDVRRFSWQMELLKKYFVPMSLDDALTGIENDDLPERAVCVTFDDGYADNASLALPVLEKWGVPACVFVATAFMNGGRMWNDTIIETIRSTALETLDLSEHNLGIYDLSSQTSRRLSAGKILTGIKHLEPERRLEVTEIVSRMGRDLPSDLMLDSKQLMHLASAGIEIGAHTQTHPILSSLSDHVARQEIVEGKHELEKILDKPVKYFAYPNGRPNQDFMPAHRDMLPELGFRAAVTTQKGVSTNETDPFMLPRFTPWDRTPLKFMSRLILNGRCEIVSEQLQSA